MAKRRTGVGSKKKPPLHKTKKRLEKKWAMLALRATKRRK